MGKKIVFVLYSHGTNCEEETMEAIRLAGGYPRLVALRDIYERRVKITDCDIIVVPGGFSYGDYPETGMMVAVLLEEHLPLLIEHKIPILGICNGTQIIVRAGLLGEGVAMVRNKSGVFCSRPIKHKVLKSNCVWTTGLEDQILTFPAAHGYGRFHVKKDAIAEVVMEYDGFSPNGGKIAMMTDPTGLIGVIMDHPERTPDNPDGQKIFRCGLAAV